MSAAKRSSGETIVAVLEAKRDATVSDIAAAAGLGRSTVGKVLARLASRARPSQPRQARRWPPAAGPLGDRRAQEASAGTREGQTAAP